jgi:hypothetical protein
MPEFKQVCFYVDKPNSNGSIYPRAVVEKELERIKEVIKNRCLIGELGTPGDSIVHFSNASHIVKDLSLVGETVEATIEVLNTPSGKVLQQLLSDKSVCFRPRGTGDGHIDENGNFVVGKNYKLVSIDAVSMETKS